MKLSAIAILAALALPAHAEFWSGATLMSRLTSPDRAENAQAIGYVMGVADAMYGLTHCPPPNTTAMQIVEMTVAGMIQSPGEWHRSADIFVRAPLEMMFPCPKEREQTETQPRLPV